MNKQAFRLGRLAAADPARLADMMKGQDEVVAPKTLDAMSLDEIIAHRSKHADRLPERPRWQSAIASWSTRFATPRPRAVMAMRCRARSRSTTPSCWPTRTSTRSRGSSPTAGSKSSSATSSRATSSSTSTSRRRSSAAASMRWAGRRSAPSARGCCRCSGVLAKIQVPARHAARHLRPQRRPQARARSDRRLREGRRHRARPVVAGDASIPRSNCCRCPTASAATAR